MNKMYLFFDSIAFLEFQDKAVANEVKKRKQQAKIQDRVLIVDHAGKAHTPEVSKKDKKDTKEKKSTKGKILQTFRKIRAALVYSL